MSKSSSLPAVNQSTNGGKKKLDRLASRDLRPLRGKVFFLDLPGHKCLEAISNKLTQRGATVEKCFHRGVKYLVTNRHKTGNKMGMACMTPSPDTPENEVGIASPFSNSSNSAKPVSHGTRRAKILAASLEKRGKVDMLQVARSFGMKVISLEDLMVQLRKFKPFPPARKDGHKTKERKYKVTQLKPPFLKVDDCFHVYRPLIYETDTWPLPLPDCPPHASPYDPPRVSGRMRVAQPSRATGARLTQELPASPPMATAVLTPLPAAASPTAAGPTPAATVKKRPGYCECCAAKYEDLKMHLKTKKHQAYANSDANFTSLDALAAQGGLSFDAFIKRVNERQKLDNIDSVVFVTPPNSPSGFSSQIDQNMAAVGTTECLPMTEIKCITLNSRIYSSPKHGSLYLTPLKASPSAGECSKKPAGEQICSKRLREVPAKLPPCKDDKERKKKKDQVITNFQELLDEVTRDSTLNSSMTLSPGTSPQITAATKRQNRKKLHKKNGNREHAPLTIVTDQNQSLPCSSAITSSLTLSPQLQSTCVSRRGTSMVGGGVVNGTQHDGRPILLENVIQSLVYREDVDEGDEGGVSEEEGI